MITKENYIKIIPKRYKKIKRAAIFEGEPLKSILYHWLI